MNNRTILTLFFAGLLLVFLGSSALAFKINDNAYLKFKEEIRYENWSTFEKPNTHDDQYDFVSSKMRLGFGFNSQLIDAYAEANWTQFFGLPRNASYGTGALYYGQNNGARDVGKVGIDQAWIRGRLPGMENLSATIGRFKYNSGLEYQTMPKNKRLAWLRKLRVSQRLIGGFEWSRVGRAFDGGQITWNNDLYNFTVAAMQPTPGGFYLDYMDDDYRGANGRNYKTHDVDIITAVFTLKDSVIEGLDAQLFYYYYNDDRHLANQDPEINNFGAHILYVTPKIGPGSIDLLFWGDIQTGTWGGNDQSAYAVALEAGYKFEDIDWQPWVRAGYFIGSGDDDADDNDRDTFFQMMPTLRIYAMTPWFNLMNTTYCFGQLMFKPMDNVLVRTDVTRLWLTEEEDAWYQGSGMTRADIFGFKGLKPASGEFDDDDLGTMWDLSLFIKDIYKFNGVTMGLDLYYSHVWGDDVVEEIFTEEDDLDFFYAELRFTF